MDISNLTSLPLETVAAISAASVLILQGLKAQFNITNTMRVRLIHILIILWMIIAVSVNDDVVKMVNTFLVIWLGANGVYDFLPVSIKRNVIIDSYSEQDDNTKGE